MRLSFLDIPKINRKSKNAIIMFMSSYIVSIWKARKCNMDPNVSQNYIKRKFLQNKRELMYIFGDKIENVLALEVCIME